MRKKQESLNPKQVNLLAQVAAGLTVTEAAHTVGYSVKHASRLYRSPEGQAEIVRLTRESQDILAKELPDLVAAALKHLKWELTHGHNEMKFRASKVVLRLAQPLIKDMMQNATDNASGVVIDLEH